MKTTNRQTTSKKDWLKRKYGLTLEEQQRALKRQNYCCLICNTFEADLPKKRYKNGILKADTLQIDYCYVTGRICGLLCCRCKRLLGSAKEDTAILQRAIAYLVRCRKGIVPEKKKESLIELASRLKK